MVEPRKKDEQSNWDLRETTQVALMGEVQLQDQTDFRGRLKIGMRAPGIRSEINKKCHGVNVSNLQDVLGRYI